MSFVNGELIELPVKFLIKLNSISKVSNSLYIRCFSFFNFQKIFSQKGLNYPLDIIAIGIKVSMKRGAFETIWSKIRGRPVRCDAMTNFYKARSAAQSFTIC